MAKLLDIKCFWNMAFEEDYNNLDKWEGQILLEEDGWFEGVVTAPNNRYELKNCFIFGVYHSNKIIELFKLSPLSVYHGVKDEVGYNGEFEIINSLGSLPGGNSCIMVQSPKNTIDIPTEIEILEFKIQKYKSNIKYKEEYNFYTNIASIRNVLTKLVMINYIGRKFTSEEADIINRELKPLKEQFVRR